MFKQREDQEKAVCPFNKNHTFAREKLIFHINRCKDREKVSHLFATCRYNGLHFIKKEDLEMHELTCPDKAEVKRMIDTMRRNFEELSIRERSREKRPKEEQSSQREREREKDRVKAEEEEDVTLSDCEECQAILRTINIDSHPKLKKYLIKYEEYSKIKFEQ